MKILMVNKFLHANGGSETYIFEIGKRLQESGHEVQYFGMEHPDRIVGNQLELYTSNMDFHGNKLTRLLYPFKIIYSREAYQKIGDVLKAFDPDAVHINNFNFQLTPSILYAIRKYEKIRNRRLPVIVTAHDSQLVCPDHLMKIPSGGQLCFACEGGKFKNCTKNKCIQKSAAKSLLATIEGYLYRFLKTYRLIDKIICPSEFLNRRLSTNPILADKTLTLHNFVNIEDDKVKLYEKKEYVVYFGRYSEEKGITMLLEICRSLPEISFIFAGTGPFRDEIARIDNIEDRGFLTGTELKKLVAEARFCLFPSQVHENCSFTVIESQLWGTPVVGSNLGGTPELIKDGETGELLDYDNINLWVQKVKELWLDVKKCRKYTENCFNVRFYTVEQYCDILLKLYGFFDE